ncbi:MAG: hypothetical protein QG650_1093 [Patescibacteria group bacterium]|nr:hypothetical protein [Patescibacteria group bacterium]
MLPFFETAGCRDPENVFCPLEALEGHAIGIVREFEQSQVLSLCSSGDRFEANGIKFEVVDRKNVRATVTVDSVERQFYLLFSQEADRIASPRVRREESALLRKKEKHLVVFFGRFEEPPVPGKPPAFTEWLKMDGEMAASPYSPYVASASERLRGDHPKRQALRIFCSCLRAMAEEYEHSCETQRLIERFAEEVDVIVPIQ